MDQNSLNSLNLQLIPQSLVVHNGVEYGLARLADSLRLVVSADDHSMVLSTFKGDITSTTGKSLLVGPLNPQNAVALRFQLPWLQPCLLGLRTSAGMGDRIGLATPGHVRAIRAIGSSIAPIFPQQSIREMERTGRTPQQVMDDAMWGVFQENWQGGFGADADHLKTPEDIDLCLAAGFTFFTIDPGAYVDDRAETASLDELRELATKLPSELQLLNMGLLNRTLQIEQVNVSFNEGILLKAMVKYGFAILHVQSMFNHLAEKAGSHPFELEVSVDETEQPTSLAEHVYIASELKRLRVKWVSLAPRFIGRFEKGVDYIGDVTAFETDFAGHAAIARHYGPYKLSLHSGSDKFSIYSAAMRQTRGLVHLKTAGTSYLEALRTIASKDVDLFREIYIFARERFEFDKVTYHVSAELSRAPLPELVKDWPDLLNQFDSRQILHHTFGSVLKAQTEDGKMRFYDRFMALLHHNPEVYAENLKHHFIRHLQPFSQVIKE